MNYYNEFEPFAAKWLRNLIEVKLIPAGTVDERSICDVQPSDLDGFTQCHFFAGIGGWSRALQLAGWPTDRPVWTGSCPCQPYSSAGKGKGDADERNLWPEMFRLVRECRPVAVFGEQVAGAVRHGWLDGISADLEGEGYAVGATVLGAHSVAAPHIRQRLYWVADAKCGSTERHRYKMDGTSGCMQEETQERERLRADVGDVLPTCTGRVGNGKCERSQRHRTAGREQNEIERQREERHGSSSGFWSDYDIIPFRDGKARRAEPGTFPLAHGVPARVGRLRGYGNAIVPQVAAEFISAWMEVCS